MRRLTTLGIAVFTTALLAPSIAADDSDPGSPDPAEMFKQLDANSDGQLSDDEVPQEHKRLFKRLLRTADADDDGQLSGEEFAAGLSAKPDEGDKPDRPGQHRERPGDRRFDPQMLFKRMDRNGDGKVVLDEIPEQRRERFARLLERGDKDGDEALSLEEFTGAFPGRRQQGNQPGDTKTPQGRPEGRPDPRQFFERLDANGDGKVTVDEVPERAKPFVERMVNRRDKDGDGAVSLEELAAARPGGPRPEGKPGRRTENPSGNQRGRLLALFMALDSDRDRVLTEEEISAAASLIRKLDADGDGNVTFKEVMATGRAEKAKE